MFNFIGRKRSGKIVDPNSQRSWTVGNSRVEVGRFTYGSEKLTIRQWREGANLTIGSFCSLAEGITIFLGGNHRTDWISTFPFGHVFKDELGETPHLGHPATRGNVNIGSDVWIGQNVTLLSGITLGNGAVVGTGAIVVNDVGPYSIVGGNPAKEIGKRFNPEIVNLLQRLCWWNLPIESIRSITPQLSSAPTSQILSDLIEIYRERKEGKAE